MAVFLYPPISVSTSNGPSAFIQDGSQQIVTEDTTNPANNAAMPSKLFIQKDGQQLPVTKDTGTPSNNVAVPVELVGASGPINITAGDLNVQLTDLGSNFDRTRIGDGTNQWNMNASNEGLVHDADVLAELQTINTNTSGLATEVTLDAVKTAVELVDDTIATNGGAALTKFQTVGGHTGSTSHAWHVDGSGLGRVDVRSSVLPTGAATESTLATLATEATALSTYNEIVTFGNESNTNQLVQIDLIGSKTETAPATDTASSGLNGRLQRIAQRLTSLIALFPTSLGQKTSANSLAVVLPSDQVVATRENALSAGTTTDTTISGATVTTILAPVGARGMKIQAGINNTADLLVGLGGVTPNNTTNIGLEFQGGRSEDIIGSSNVEVTSADPLAVNQKIVIVWSYV